MKKMWFFYSFAIPAALTLAISDLYLPTSALARAQEMPEWSVPVNLGPVINSQFDEVLPCLAKNGLSLFFASNRPADSFGNFDIWVSQRETRDDPWGPPMNLGPTINTAFNDRAPNLSRDGHFLFFGSSRPGGFGPGTQDIWVSYREHTHDDFGWQAPVNLGAGVNSVVNDFGAGFLENDDTGIPNLFFGRVPGDIGGADIYMSELLADGSFGNASVIEELSTPYNDLRPTLRPNGLELFFNSDRPDPPDDPESGDNDLWFSTRETIFSPWSTPVNVGSPVNADDSSEQFPALSSDGATLIFTSNRSGSVGGPDLYMSSRKN